jgi:carboxymethylenebutenolidase
MSDLGRYILEEWREDYQEGRISRRELLRRITVFAGGAAASIPLLHSLGVAASAEEVSRAAAGPLPELPAAFASMVPPDDPAIDGRMVTFPAGSVSMIAYLAQPKGRPQSPGVLIVHENQGLLDHFKDVARRFVKAGYAAIAPDLASPAGGTARFTDPAEVTAYLGRTPPEQHVALLGGAVGYLQELPAVRRDRVGAIGFCFGGGLVWRLAAANPALKAAAPFYGSNPPIEDVPRIRAAILAVYGAADERIDAGIPAIRQAMERAGVVHDIVIYAGAGHAFFNDTGARYNASAAQDAWMRVLAWFARYLSA